MGTKRSGTDSQYEFSRVPTVQHERSTFNRSCGVKTAFDAGWLIPIFCDEVLPGDTMNLKMSHFARLATPLHPVMDNMWLDTFFFFIPNRLCWGNWERFNGEQDDPDDSIDFTIPTTESAPTVGHLARSLSDYLGFPTAVPDLVHSVMWHRAYSLIYDDWFRDENLQDSIRITFFAGDGPDGILNFPLQRRGKRHDYFTSCLPWPSKGEAVTGTLHALIR